jgi:WD40 repeat protein
MFLVAHGEHLEVCDRRGFELIERYTDPTLRNASHDDSLRNIVLHPSGGYAATSAGDRDRAVKVWELSSGKLIGTVTSPGTTPTRLAWSGDGRYLLATSAGFVSRWRFSPAESQRFACLSGSTVASATVLPGGRVAALGELRNGKRELNVELPGGRRHMNWLTDAGGFGRAGLSGAPEGAILATLDTPGIFHWRPEKSAPPLGFTKHPARCARISPDGKTLWAVVNSQEVHSFDLATRQLRDSWSNSAEEVLSGLASLDALAAGNDAVAAGGVNGAVYVLDPATCKPKVTFPRSGDPVLAVAVAPDDSLVVAGTQQGMLRVMCPTEKIELPPVAAHPDGTTAVAINRDGTLLATGGRDRAVRLWRRVGDRFEPLLAVSDLPGAVRELQFSPGDNRLIVLISHGHAVRVWDVDRLRAQLTELKLGW